MHTKVALLVVYNHRYDQNIPRIESLYKGKFSHIYHLIPFYDGEVPNVIPVYAHSHYFQSYISQAYPHLKNEQFTHYFVVSDDMLLHPSIDEQNLWDTLNLEKDSCLFPGLMEIQKLRNIPWNQTPKALNYRVVQDGVEIKNILPTKEKACELFAKHNISTAPIDKEVYTHIPIYKKRFKYKRDKETCSIWFRHAPIPNQIQLDYPLVGGYSDIFLVTADCMQKFCTYCGAFAASHLFVELAVPTSMVLAAKKITYIHELKLKAGDMWTAEQLKILEPYNYNLSALQEHFPNDKLFLHPIKLSKWK